MRTPLVTRAPQQRHSTARRQSSARHPSSSSPARHLVSVSRAVYATMNSVMHAEDAGSPDGSAMVLIHGFLSSNVQWDLNRDDLCTRHRLILVELPGHGSSDAPDDQGGYTAEHIISELERIRTERDIEQWWVCGQSLGGAIATLYCLAHPERILGLIFTNSRAAFGIGRRGVSREPGEPAPVLRSTRDLPVHPINAKRIDERLKARMVAAADAMPLHAVNHFTALRHTWRAVDHMSSLTMPVLLVNGRWEKAFQPFVETAEQLIPQFEHVPLEGGHAINAEQPDAFNEAVRVFVERHSNQRTEEAHHVEPP